MQKVSHYGFIGMQLVAKKVKISHPTKHLALVLNLLKFKSANF